MRQRTLERSLESNTPIAENGFCHLCTDFQTPSFIWWTLLINEIRLAINELLKQGQSAQDNKALLALLEREYKLPAKVRNEIIALVEGRKAGSSSAKASPLENRRELQNICGERYKVGVKFEDKEGNFIGLEELKKRVAVKKSQLGMKLKSLSDDK